MLTVILLLVCAQAQDAELPRGPSPDTYRSAPIPALIALGDREEAHFGSQISPAGDVNGDGYDDVMLTAQRHATTAIGTGMAYLHLGSATGLGRTAAWTAAARNGDRDYVAHAAGDVNGDGFADVVTASSDGVKLFLGSKDGLASAPASVFPGATNRVAPAGDVNGDGYADVLVGLAMLHGSETGLSPKPAWSLNRETRERDRITAVGDINGDGFDDAIVTPASEHIPGPRANDARRRATSTATGSAT